VRDSQSHLAKGEVKFKKERVRVGLDLFEAAQSSKNLNKKNTSIILSEPKLLLMPTFIHLGMCFPHFGAKFLKVFCWLSK
jgi:hypothetical protein